MFTLAKAALASWIFAALIVASMGIVARAQKSDLAVVFGNTVHSDGVPSERLAARLERAFQCYEQAQCAMIFVSGGINKQGTDEALAMKDYLVRVGVPVSKIVVDSLGVDTWATAKNAAAYMKSNDMSSVMVTTQYFHIPRATIAFKKNGISKVSGAYPRFFEARDIYSTFREVPAIVWYVIRTDLGEDKEPNRRPGKIGAPHKRAPRRKPPTLPPPPSSRYPRKARTVARPFASRPKA